MFQDLGTIEVINSNRGMGEPNAVGNADTAAGPRASWDDITASTAVRCHRRFVSGRAMVVHRTYLKYLDWLASSYADTARQFGSTGMDRYGW
jgi:hypothetical protein